MGFTNATDIENDPPMFVFKKNQLFRFKHEKACIGRSKYSIVDDFCVGIDFEK